jgi:hypothetical protein
MLTTLTSSFLFLHIAAGSLAIVSGYAALFAPKGGWLHRRSGMLFVYTMLVMGAGAVVIGLVRGKPAWLGGPFVFYLVITSMLTVRRTQTPSRSRDIALMLLALSIAILSIVGGFTGMMAPPGTKTDGGVPVLFPAVMSLVNAFVLLLCVAGDVRVLRSGALKGTKRLRRHLWRMCYAMFTATGSFFLGQSQVIPEAVRIPSLIWLLAMLPLPLMFYWLLRLRRPPKRMMARVQPLTPPLQPSTSP